MDFLFIYLFCIKIFIFIHSYIFILLFKHVSLSRLFLFKIKCISFSILYNLPTKIFVGLEILWIWRQYPKSIIKIICWLWCFFFCFVYFPKWIKIKNRGIFFKSISYTYIFYNFISFKYNIIGVNKWINGFPENFYEFKKRCLFITDDKFNENYCHRLKY